MQTIDSRDHDCPGGERVNMSAKRSLGIILVSLLALLFWVSVFPHPAQAQTPGFSNPVDNQAISGNIPIMGTAVIDPFQKYELHFKQDPSGDDAFVYFDGGTTPIVNGQLGFWQAGGLPPGRYTLRLRVVKQDGNYAEYFARNIALNQGPVATPTLDQPPTPTPIPIPSPTFTPVVQPTPVVVAVEQPPVAGDSAPTAPGGESGAVAQDAQPNTRGEAVAAAIAGDLGADQTSAQVADSGDTVGSAVARELGAALALDRLQSEFMRGMRISALIALAGFILFGGKALLRRLLMRS